VKQSHFSLLSDTLNCWAWCNCLIFTWLLTQLLYYWQKKMGWVFFQP